jgi:hypothetical protein
MGKSGNPARKAEELKISQVGDFKKRMGGVMELPSGAVVKLKNPGGMRAFLKSGVIPNSLMGIIQKAMNTGKKPDMSELAPEGKLDDKMLEDMSDMMDAVAIQCIIEPPVLPKPADEADRSEDLLYIDEFPDDDKQFIFQWVSGGVKDLEAFRRQRDEGMDALVAIPGFAPESLLSAGPNDGIV